MADPIDASRETIEAEKIRLVETDLAQTNEFIKGVLATGAALRGSAITVWLALLGFAAQQSMPMLALLAAVVATAFWFADGYHGWLYGEAFSHAQKIERLLSIYYDTLSRRQDSPRAQIKLAGRLRAHRYGLYNSFRHNFTPKQLWRGARPRLFYRYLYPVLALIAVTVGIAGLLGFNFKSGTPSPTRIIVEGGSQTASLPAPTPLPAPTTSTAGTPSSTSHPTTPIPATASQPTP